MGYWDHGNGGRYSRDLLMGYWMQHMGAIRDFLRGYSNTALRTITRRIDPPNSSTPLSAPRRPEHVSNTNLAPLRRAFVCTTRLNPLLHACNTSLPYLRSALYLRI